MKIPHGLLSSGSCSLPCYHCQELLSAPLWSSTEVTGQGFCGRATSETQACLLPHPHTPFLGLCLFFKIRNGPIETPQRPILGHRSQNRDCAAVGSREPEKFISRAWDGTEWLIPEPQGALGKQQGILFENFGRTFSLYTGAGFGLAITVASGVWLFLLFSKGSGTQ